MNKINKAFKSDPKEFEICPFCSLSISLEENDYILQMSRVLVLKFSSNNSQMFDLS